MRQLAALALLVWVSPVLAQSKPAGPPPMPTPPAEMAQMNWMIGSWICSGKQDPSPTLPDGKRETREECKAEMGGFWIECGTFPLAGPMKDKEVFESFTIYDAQQKKWVRHAFNVGGNKMATSSGFEGTKMVWAGEGQRLGKKITIKYTLNRKSDSEYSGAVEIDGKPTAEETCKKK